MSKHKSRLVDISGLTGITAKTKDFQAAKTINEQIKKANTKTEKLKVLKRGLLERNHELDKKKAEITQAYFKEEYKAEAKEALNILIEQMCANCGRLRDVDRPELYEVNDWGELEYKF